MKEQDLLPVNIDRLLDRIDVIHHLGNDLVLCKFDDIPWPEENRHMECTFVGLCTAGEGRYSAGAIEHRFQANDVLVVGEGQVLGDIKLSKEMMGDGLLISHEFLYDVIRDVRDVTNLFVFSREHPVISLSFNEVAMFREYITILKQKIDDPNHLFRRQIAGTLLGSMIYDLCNATRQYIIRGQQRQSRSQDTFKEFLKLVEANFRGERRVSWYSNKLGMTPKTLLEVVKRVSQRTPNEWLDIYTTLELRLLLRHTDKPVKVIAEELHFGSQSSLGKFFREHVGVSPTEYRQIDEESLKREELEIPGVENED